MSYKIILLKTPSKILHKLPKEQVKRIIGRIDSLSDDPRPSGCMKIVSEYNRYRIRVGDYRILYTISDKDREVVIYRIMHRKEGYK